MKKIIIASTIGIVASVAMVSSSYGQGQVVFANTDYGSFNAPVTFATDGTVNGNAVTAGWGVGSEFQADLLFSLDGGSTFTLLTPAMAANQTGQYPTPFYATDGDSANGAGYFSGPAVTIPGYSSGSITFEVQAWYGGATYAAASVNQGVGWIGTSAPFTVASIATGQSAANTFPVGSMQPFTVSAVPVPEPSTLALAGLGGLGLLMAFRRKKVQA